MAVDQPEVFGVPAQIFTIENRIVDGHILCFPERVLRRNLRIAYLGVLHILEYIFGVAHQSVYFDVLAEHEWIGAVVQRHVIQRESVYAPECLVGIVDGDIAEF